MADETPTTEGPAPSSEASPEPSRTRSAASSATTTAKQRVKDTSSSRTIFGLMVFAVGFALIGNEVQILGKKAPGTPAPSTVSQAGSTITSSGRIILGGFFATSILVLLSHAGDPGNKIAVGLAGITALSSVLLKRG